MFIRSAYFIHCLETGEPITGPLSLEISRSGQQIVDTAVIIARDNKHRSPQPAHISLGLIAPTGVV
jgi:hypothetical protein